MDVSADIQNAMSMARSAPVQAPQAGQTPAATKKAAKDFEAVFISQFLGSMFEGIKTDGEFGGGQGEQMFRSLMLDQYGKSVTEQGGFGIADAVTRSLNNRQQAQQQAQQQAADAAKAKTDGTAAAPPATAPALPTQKTQPVFAAHPVAVAANALAAKPAPVFAAHPATLFAASAAASRMPARSAAR